MSLGWRATLHTLPALALYRQQNTHALQSHNRGRHTHPRQSRSPLLPVFLANEKRRGGDNPEAKQTPQAVFVAHTLPSGGRRRRWRWWYPCWPQQRRRDAILTHHSERRKTPARPDPTHNVLRPSSQRGTEKVFKAKAAPLHHQNSSLQVSSSGATMRAPSSVGLLLDWTLGCRDLPFPAAAAALGVSGQVGVGVLFPFGSLEVLLLY